MFTIMKNGKFVKDFSNGEEFTKGRNQAEYFYSKKAASVKASEYGRKFGAGYTVVEATAPAWMK